MNHFTTATILFKAIACFSELSASAEAFKKLGSNNKSGCSPQYLEYSFNDVGDKIKGGAVNVDKSPLKDAIDFKKEVQDEEDAILDMV